MGPPERNHDGEQRHGLPAEVCEWAWVSDTGILVLTWVDAYKPR